MIPLLLLRDSPDLPCAGPASNRCQTSQRRRRLRAERDDHLARAGRANCLKPASAIVRTIFLSPCVIVSFSLIAWSNNRLRSGKSDGAFRLRPFGLPLWPGLNWYSFGGRRGPTLYSSVDVAGGRAVAPPPLLLPRASFWRCSQVTTKSLRTGIVNATTTLPSM